MTGPDGVPAAGSEVSPELVQLEARLRTLAGEADPVPEDVLTAARAALALRALDAELAELVADSAVDRLVGVRGGGDEPRLLTWEAGELGVEVQVTSTRDGVELRGQVSGADPGAVLELQDSTGARVGVTPDVDGSFVLDVDVEVAAARLRLWITEPSGRRVVTGWLAP